VDQRKDAMRREMERLLTRLHGERCTVTAISERAQGPQGYSGSRIRNYDVTSRDAPGNVRVDQVVSKDAVLLERRILQHLADQHCAVPPVAIADLTSDERAPVYMPYLDPQPEHFAGGPNSLLTLSIADGLAGIHAANRGRCPPWLPRTADDWYGRLWLRAWRERWEENLTWPDFRAEFGACTARLSAAMERLLRTLDALASEESTLTLLNVDLTPAHIRFMRGEACFIDWQQSSYGPLYIDLPNHFTIETALVYRDALARRGHEIPVVEFLERYHEVSHYMGLRYLGYSLGEWAAGGERRQAGRWFLYYTFSLALNGR
jgi:hypothetical protein